jgi:hypothetical protein
MLLGPASIQMCWQLALSLSLCHPHALFEQPLKGSLLQLQLAAAVCSADRTAVASDLVSTAPAMTVIRNQQINLVVLPASRAWQ